jgi:ribosomal protein S18 acetylase RimI-like enzyme
MTIGDSLVVDCFELTRVDIATVEVETLHALSIAVRWPHRAEDWRMLCAVGEGVAVRDSIGRIVGTAMWFPYGGAFMTVGMVITSPRLQRQGAGRWLMKHVMAQAGDRTIRLNATRAAQRLYASLGFTPEARVFQYNGLAVGPEDSALPPGGVLRAAELTDLSAIAALDARAFGANRAALMARLMEASRATVLLREGQIAAFALCRSFGRGHVVGPIVARDDDDAIAVTRPHVADHAGRFLRIDTRQADGAFPAFLTRCGMPVYDPRDRA